MLNTQQPFPKTSKKLECVRGQGAQKTFDSEWLVLVTVASKCALTADGSRPGLKAMTATQTIHDIVRPLATGLDCESELGNNREWKRKCISDFQHCL
eukprot:957678-Amphidinium_carterae.1